MCPGLVTAACGTLDAGTSLTPGQSILSCNGKYTLTFQASDGNVVLYGPAGALWSTDTGGQGATIFSMNPDGNLVLYSGSTPLWATSLIGGTTGRSAHLRVQDDANLVVYADDTGQVFWSSGINYYASSLDRKLIVGYQGWFWCSTDQYGGNSWSHWFNWSQTADPSKLDFDFMPDVSELGADERCDTGLKLHNGNPFVLFSNQNPKTVNRQFTWMAQYGIDAAAVQRFVVSLENFSHKQATDKVLDNVRYAAEANSRGFYLMYDISGANASTWAQTVQNDWQQQIQSGLTQSLSYVHDGGKPVLAIYIGFNDRPGTAAEARALIANLRAISAPAGGVTLIGVVPTGWRTLNGDSNTDPAWGAVYRSFDIISPWSVGRYSDTASYNTFLNSYTIPDMAEANQYAIRYMPIIFPGFSWANLMRQHGISAPYNQTPRGGGQFLWTQAIGVVGSGATMIYAAMFDEVDEGTALFKMVPTNALTPQDVRVLALDVDGQSLPSDWYLQVSSAVSKMLKGQIGRTNILPIIPPAPTADPTISLDANGQGSLPIYAGDQYALNWSSLNVMSCSLLSRSVDGTQYTFGIVPNSAGSSITGLIGSYTFTCTGSNGQPVSKTVQITQLNDDPVGYLDGINASGALYGWTYDPDASSQSIAVHIYMDGPVGAGGQFINAVTANQPRPDANTAVSITGDHGFSWQIPSQYLSAAHTWYVYGIDSTGGTNPILSGSPVTSAMAIGAIRGYKILLAGSTSDVPATIASQPVTVQGIFTGTSNPYSYQVSAGQTHTVSVPALSGYSIGYTLCIDNNNCHSSTPTPGNSVSVNLPAGTEHYADLWWHYTPPNSEIQGTIWNDSNANQIIDVDEQGFSDRTITLTQNDSTITTARTDASGRYTYPNVAAGTYLITHDYAPYISTGMFCNDVWCSSDHSHPIIITASIKMDMGMRTARSCTFNERAIQSGTYTMAYQQESVPATHTCVAQARTCTDGTLSGSYPAATCTVESVSALSCSFNGQIIANGSSVTAYEQWSVPATHQCVSQQRTCSNGTLSGSYYAAGCSVEASAFNLKATPNPCTIPSGASTCTSAISWTVPAGNTVQVWIQEPNDVPKAFACSGGPITITKNAPWITSQGVTFLLYKTNSCAASDIAGKNPEAILAVAGTQGIVAGRMSLTASILVAIESILKQLSSLVGM